MHKRGGFATFRYASCQHNCQLQRPKLLFRARRWATFGPTAMTHFACQVANFSVGGPPHRLIFVHKRGTFHTFARNLEFLTLFTKSCKTIAPVHKNGPPQTCSKTRVLGHRRQKKHAKHCNFTPNFVRFPLLDSVIMSLVWTVPTLGQCQAGRQ